MRAGTGAKDTGFYKKKQELAFSEKVRQTGVHVCTACIYSKLLIYAENHHY